jgi:hypothetical protein
MKNAEIEKTVLFKKICCSFVAINLIFFENDASRRTTAQGGDM